MTALLDYFHEAVTTKKEVDKLKKLILRFAIQGKLVEQVSNDEPASELLKKIKEDKDQLINDKKVRMDIVSSISSKDLIENPIPNGWELARIGQIMNPINGLAFKPSDWSNQGLPIIRIQNLNNLNATFNYCDFEVDEKFIVNNGNILIGWSGTPGTSFGAFIWNRGKAVLNQHIFKADMYGNYLNQEYIMYAINANLENMIEKAHGGVGLQHITKGKFLDIILTIPPFSEQNRIVKKIHETFESLDKLSIEIVKKQMKSELLSKITLTKLQDHTNPFQMENLSFIISSFEHFCNDKASIHQFRNSILSLAVQGKLVPQDPNDEPASVLLEKIRVEKEQLINEGKIKKEKPLPPITKGEIPYKLPIGWEWVRLGDIIKEKPRNGYSPKSVDYPTAVKSLTLTATTSGKFKPECYKYIDESISNESYLWLEYGDILIQRSNSLEYVGTSCIFTGESRTFIYPDLMMKIQVLNYVELQYLHLVLSSQNTREYFRKYASGTSSSMPKINQSIVLNTLVAIPPHNEQIRIVNKVDQLMALFDELKKTVEQSKYESEMLMKSVLQEAFQSA